MRFKKMFMVCVLGWAIPATVSVVPDAADWRPDTDGWGYIRQVGDIELYRRPAQQSRFPELLARTRFASPATRVFEVISDYSHFTDFIPSVAESRVLERSGHTTRVYQRLQLPVFVADRHYVIGVTDRLQDDGSGTVHVAWQLDGERSRALSGDGLVVPESFRGYWHLTRDASGSACDAIYSVHVEPGGKLPAWLFTRAAERYVLDVVEAVRERAGRPDRSAGKSVR